MRFSPLVSLFLVISAFAGPGFAAPSNDHFTERHFITGFSNAVVGTTVGATADASDPTFGMVELSGNTVWWGWNAPFSGIASISTTGTSFRHYLAVYTGSQLPSLTKVSEQFSDTVPAVLATFPVQAGTPYALLLDGLSGVAGDVRLTLILHPGPANDDFEKRARLTGTNLVFVGNNLWATAQAGEPPGFENSVWWSWRAPEPGTLRIIPTPAFPPLTLWCFTGAELSGLRQVGAGLPLTVTVERGVDYTIRMGSYMLGYEREFNLIFESTSIYEVPNDHFTNRFVLSGTNASFGGSVRRATSEMGMFTFPGDRNSLWWSWTAPMDGGVIFTLSTPNFAPRLVVYTGNALSNLNLVTDATCCNNTNFGAFIARRGETYSIMVGSFNGVGEFTAKFNMVPPPPNDHFANREVLPEMTNRLTTTGVVLATGARGSTRYASVEAGESVTQSVFRAVATVWWSWRPTMSGRVSLDVSGPSPDRPLVGVFTGDVVSNLVPIAVSRLPAPPGAFYTTRVDSMRFPGFLTISR